MTASGTKHIGAIDLGYDVRGEGPPLLLVPGFGMTRLMWRDSFCAQLVAQGLTVVRMDNRDTGSSSRLEQPAPDLRGSLVRSLLGRPIAAPYTLSDMAKDAVGLMASLGHEKFHIAGASMGGMIAQTAAIEHGDRLRSMTSIMSTPGGRRYSIAKVGTLLQLIKPMPVAPDAQLAQMMALMKTLTGTLLPFEEDLIRAMLVEHATTKPSVAGSLRQFTAILEAGGRRLGQLPGVRTPTLVIHGSEDPLLPVRGGRATARLIPGATFLLVSGMGHGFHTAINEQVTGALGAHVKRAEERRS
ncbi:MAG: alpha/beta hydrolase [Polyangia bacterium]